MVLPDHLHAIWTLPEGDADFAKRWVLIKKGFSRHIPGSEQRSECRCGKGQRGIWQRRYWEHLIRDGDDHQRHMDYIHYKPVKHGYVQRSAGWEYSSLHRHINAGTFGVDWSDFQRTDDGVDFGERLPPGHRSRNANTFR